MDDKTPEEILKIFAAPEMDCYSCGKHITGERFIDEHNAKHLKENKVNQVMTKIKDEKDKQGIQELRDLLEANLR